MLNAILSLLAIFVFLVVVEYYWHKKNLRNERSRQIIHVCVGTFVAFWPYYMSYQEIMFCAVALLLVVLLGRYDKFLNLIKWPKSFPFKFAAREMKFIESIHKVSRPTLGDVIFPISIGLLAAFEPANYVFAIAMLNIGLADGLASIVGIKYGMKHVYKIFEQKKTVLGTITFWAVSLLILLGFKLFAPTATASLSWWTLLYLPPLLALVENFAVFGTDDLMVPLILLIVLTWY